MRTVAGNNKAPRMNNRNQPVRLLFPLFFWLAISGCGGEDVSTAPDPALNPEETPSCETLAPLVLQDPLTGGTFHCLWCNREWTWRVPADSRRLFLLIALSCERLRAEAYLELRDSEQSIVWQTTIKQGDRETYCVRHEGMSGGLLSLRLSGTTGLPLIGDLIEEFQGSVYLKVFNERGEPAGGPVP